MKHLLIVYYGDFIIINQLSNLSHKSTCMKRQIYTVTIDKAHTAIFLKPFDLLTRHSIANPLIEATVLAATSHP